MKEWFSKLGNIYVKYFFYYFTQKQKCCFPIRKEEVIEDRDFNDIDNNNNTNNLVLNHNSNSSMGQSKYVNTIIDKKYYFSKN